MARRTGFISMIVREIGKVEKQRAADEKKRQALLARMERERQREERAKERAIQQEERAKERAIQQEKRAKDRELIQWSKEQAKIEAERSRQYEKEKAEVAVLVDRYQQALFRYDLVMKQIPTITDDMPASYGDLGVTLLTEAVSYVPELMDFRTRLHMFSEQCVENGGTNWENEFAEADYYMPFLLLSGFYVYKHRYRYAIRACQDAIDLGLITGENQLTFQQVIEQVREEMEEQRHG